MLDAPSKIVVAGEMGAGKTTLIRAISDGDPIATEVPIFSGPMGEKTTTTVAFDYSSVALGDDETVHIYGMPGQLHFDFMRPILADGALGAILLLDATSPTMIDDCRHWLASLHAINPDLRIVVGITKTDLNARFSIREVRSVLLKLGADAPVSTIDPRVPDQCRHLVRALIVSIST